MAEISSKFLTPEQYANVQKAQQTVSNLSNISPNFSGVKTPSAISVDSLSSNATPINIPSYGYTEPNYNTIISGYNDTIKNLISTYNASQAPSQGTVDTLNQQILDSLKELSGQSTREAQLKNSTGYNDVTKRLSEISGEIQALNTENAAIPLQTKDEFAGRGAVKSVVSAESSDRQRQNAIKTLQKVAIAQVLQGQQSGAQSAIDSAIKSEFEPVIARVNYLQQALSIAKDNATTENKKRADTFQLLIDNEKFKLENAINDRQQIYKLATEAAKNGADNLTVSKIANSGSFSEAFSMAGNSLQDPAMKVNLEKIKLDNLLTKSQIEKSNYELKLLKEYGGLTPTQYSDKLKAEQKTINEAKTESEKSVLQGQAINEKITLLDSVLNSDSIDSVVGPSIFSRGAGTLGGFVGRFATGFGVGAAGGAVAGLPFAGIGAIPGSIIGGTTFGTLSALQGVKDYFTGSSDRLIGQTEQFISKEFLNNLINVKAQGATFGALTEKEQQALTAAATYIGQRRVYKGSGEDKQVIGYDMSEKDFREELNKIRNLAQKAFEKSTGKKFDSSESAILDELFTNQISASSYFK